MSLVLAKRLARCKMALESQNQDHRTISDIAFGWGFSDSTHFTRAFKAKYNVLPSECRKLSQSGRTGSSYA
jgi:AraC family transcriptional regulator, positive regulator of tynA and feaB